MFFRRRNPLFPLAPALAFWLGLSLFPHIALADPQTPSPAQPGDPCANFKTVVSAFAKDLPERAREDLQKTDQEIDKAKKHDDKIRVLREKLPAIAVDLTDDDLMKNVPVIDRTRAENNIAGIANQTGDYQSAETISGDALKRDPDDKDALNNVAIAHFGMHDYEHAIAEATRVTRADPDNETAYTTRALAFYEAGRYIEAAEDAKRVLSLNRNNEAAFATLRLAEGRLGPPSLNLNAKQQAESAAVKREHLAQVEQEARAETSIREAPNSISAPPAPEAGFLRQAAELTALGKPWDAIDAATRAIAANPNSAQAYALRAAAYNAAQHYTQAIADASSALKLDPKNAGALDTRASASLQIGRNLDAAQDCEESIRIDPDNPYAHVNCGRAHRALDNLDQAVADFNNAAQLNPQFRQEYAASLQELERKKLAPQAGQAQENGAADPAANPRRAKRSPMRQYLLTAAFTVIGGLLIAFGVIQWKEAKAGNLAASGPETLERESAVSTPEPAMLGHYRIVRTIAYGGMGVVYEALDQSLDRTVAIKKMRDDIKIDSPDRKRFLEEARTVAALQHPNIVEIHTILQKGDELFLVFEYVAGKTVAELIAEKGRLSFYEARSVALGVVDALEYAHGRGLVHRDLKPSNILVAGDGQVKVTDFGIAGRTKYVSDAPEAAIVGTPQYMPPEAEQGIVRPECDIYALGACFYEMLSGKRAFPGAESMPHKLALDYPRLSGIRRDLPPGVDDLIKACLQPDPNERPRTPRAFAERLEGLLGTGAA